MAFHDRLKEARIKSSYTQDQLAEMLGIGKSTLSGYENGNREPAIATVAKIIDLLKVDANYLYQDEVSSSTKMSYEDIDMNKKYRALDPHGKEMVDFTLQKEWERSTSEKDKVIEFKQSAKDHLIPNAANDRTDIEVTEEMKKEDDSFFDED